MARDLATLKDKLWDAFDEAINSGFNHEANRRNAAQFALAIVEVEREQREARQSETHPAVLKKPAN